MTIVRPLAGATPSGPSIVTRRRTCQKHDHRVPIVIIPTVSGMSHGVIMTGFHACRNVLRLGVSGGVRAGPRAVMCCSKSVRPNRIGSSICSARLLGKESIAWTAAGRSARKRWHPYWRPGSLSPTMPGPHGSVVHGSPRMGPNGHRLPMSHRYGPDCCARTTRGCECIPLTSHPCSQYISVVPCMVSSTWVLHGWGIVCVGVCLADLELCTGRWCCQS